MVAESSNEPVLNLLSGVVPECKEKLRQILTSNTASFRDLDDKEGFALGAGPYGSIQFTPRSMRQLWLFGFGGMRALHSYASVLALLRAFNEPFRISEITNLPGQAEADRQFSSVMNQLEELSSAIGEGDFHWPDGIPEPAQGRPEEVEAAAAFDLTCIATGYIFLHELKHVIFQTEGNAPDNPRDEEHACDSFARELVLGGVGQYCEACGDDPKKVLMKRSMGVALASGFIFFATPDRLLGGSESHPPVSERWRALADAAELPPDDYFWLYFASLAISLLRYKEIEVPDLPVASYRSLCSSLIEALRSGI